MSSVVDQQFWNEVYEELALTYNPETVEFRDLFETYLTPGGTCFEVGCYPGRFLTFLGERFRFTVSGIDTTPFVLDRLPQHLTSQGVEIGELFHGDFLGFSSKQRYDVVCSFGFVEHFTSLEEVLKRHISLVKPSGTLVISCPNFRGIQYLLHRILDPVNLERHVLSSMSLALWRSILERNGMQVLYQGYYRTFDFWTDSPDRSRLMSLGAGGVKRLAAAIDKRVNMPNPLLSPHMISFARKL